jgi:hypothetical protein
MELSGGTLFSMYVPDVGDNRARALAGEAHMRCEIRGMTAGEYREIANASMLKALTVKDAEISTEDLEVRDRVGVIEGLLYRNKGRETQEIGGVSVPPGGVLNVNCSMMLLDVFKYSNEVVITQRLRRDLLLAIESRSHLEAGLIPT